MLKRSIRKSAFTAITIIGLGCFASPSLAAGANLLQNLRIAPGVAPHVLLPPISNPRPYRQAVSATCNVNIPSLSLTNACIMPLDPVPANHLLQLDNINCLANSGAAFIFNTQIKLDAAHLLGFVAGPSGGASAAGPYYLKAGERAKFLATGSAPTDQAFCMAYGTLWKTN